MASFISWGNQFYTIIRTQLSKGFYGIENQYYIDEIIEEDLINTINKCMKSGKPNNKII
jgi:hypothetical protein